MLLLLLFQEILKRNAGSSATTFAQISVTLHIVTTELHLHLSDNYWCHYPQKLQTVYVIWQLTAIWYKICVWPKLAQNTVRHHNLLEKQHQKLKLFCAKCIVILKKINSRFTRNVLQCTILSRKFSQKFLL